jgi:ferritin-like metal-binding protein YciE
LRLGSPQTPARELSLDRSDQYDTSLDRIFKIERLEQVFELLGKSARGKTCEAIQGVLAEGEEIMEEYKGTAALDAGLISSAQVVQHYEIARYRTLKFWAKQLGLTDAIPLLDANLPEEIATDQKLTALGETSANPKGSKKAN